MISFSRAIRASLVVRGALAGQLLLVLRHHRHQLVAQLGVKVTGSDADCVGDPASSPPSPEQPTSASRRTRATRGGACPSPTPAVHPAAADLAYVFGHVYSETRGRCRRHHHARRRRPGGSHDRRRSRRPRPTGGHGHGHGDKEVRFATYNASLNRGAAGELVEDLSTPGNEQARRSRRSSSAPGPTCCSSTSSTSTRKGRRRTCSGTTTSRLPRPDTRPIALPLRLRGRVQHRHPQRLRPQQQRHDRRG